MAKPDMLEKAYQAVGTLRAKGLTKISVEQVAVVSGLARSTFYLTDPDWQEVLKVIKGKPSPRVKLVEIEASQSSSAARKIAELSKRIAEFESDIGSIRQAADDIYKSLIDQLQYYYALAIETPRRQELQAKYLKELGSAKQEIQRLRTEITRLSASQASSSNISPLVNKAIIDLSNRNSLTSCYSEFLDQLLDIFPVESNGEIADAIFILCGLPLSGKSKWIKNHEPPSHKLCVYVDSTGHSKEMRKFFIERLRKTTTASIHCVYLRATVETCTRRSEMESRGAAHIQMRERIANLQKEFEAVSITESFDSIILV